MTTSGERGRAEFARRLRAYMGYADRTLDNVARDLSAAGLRASPSTVNRWARGQSAPNVFAAQALGGLVERAGLAPRGGGTTWLLGAGAVAAAPELDAAVRAWQFHAASPALAEALAERGVPSAYRQPLADLLARLLLEPEAEAAAPASDAAGEGGGRDAPRLARRSGRGPAPPDAQPGRGGVEAADERG